MLPGGLYRVVRGLMRSNGRDLEGTGGQNPQEPCCIATLSSMDNATAMPPSVNTVANGNLNKGLRGWFVGMVRARRGLETAELQAMLTPHNQEASGEVCLLTESPYRILRAAENGNIDDFMRLYFDEPSRLEVRDARGRAAAHKAAAKNKPVILQFIHNNSGDLNAQDKAGNTPLHLAVQNDAFDAMDTLLKLKVDTSILNNKKQAPIHLATELNKVAALQVLVKYKSIIDIEQCGENGRTALHLAAIYDHEQCARILIMEFDACPRRACANGYYPIHEAAKNASSRTMEVFLQWAESKGCTREQMISFHDNEGNAPLHSAVHGGDIKAVELCLKSGAIISNQQLYLSTPVHLACAQGAVDMVRLMFAMQPKEKMTCLASCDIQNMTPLHCAAMFDHPNIVEYLVAEGSDLNPLDKERRSPLLLAASRGAWRSVHVLIRLGANITLTDANNCNVLHLVVINGGRLEEFANICKEKAERNLYKLLNEKDVTGCSPLHYASREGHIRSLESLLKLGATINPKNNENQSPLHFAARYGRYNTVCQLLDSEKGTFIINESDGEGMTPLHIASQQGHMKVVQLLLNRGALLHRDHNGRNPLHLAAMNGYTQTIELLHSIHSHLLDQTDKDMNTALHLATMENQPNSIGLLLSMGCQLARNKMGMSAIDYAIYYKFPEAALAMVTHDKRASEVMQLRSDRHPCVTMALIAFMPRVFQAVQDNCIIRANCKKDSKSYYIKYNFAALLYPHYEEIKSKRDENKASDTTALRSWSPLPALNIKYSFEHYQKTKNELSRVRAALNDPFYRPQPLCVINAMVAHGRVDLLSHPLSQKYLQMKWNSYGKYFHLTNLLFYCIFLMFATVYVYFLKNTDYNDGKASVITYENATGFNNLSSYKDDNNRPDVHASTTMSICTIAILLYNAISMIREAYNVYLQKGQYLLDPSNLVSWSLFLCTTLMVLPGDHDFVLSAAAISAFLCWYQLLLLLQRFDQVGLYVVMFLEILKTLIKVLIVFSILIIAFGLSFFILMSQVGENSISQNDQNEMTGEHLSFKSIPMSVMRTFAMMLGEIDFVGTYVTPFYNNQVDKSLPLPAATFFILCLFMVLMPILLMNLLIGLAVGDIDSVRRNAQLKRLAMQVVLHTELERKLPHFILEKVDKTELIEFPNHTKSKLGVLDIILRKWFCNPFNDDGLDMERESHEDYVANEFAKQKRRIKELTRNVDQTYQLLRLVVQKMEIRTEADDVDEGVARSELHPRYLATQQRRTIPRIRKRLRSSLSMNKTR